MRDPAGIKRKLGAALCAAALLGIVAMAAATTKTKSGTVRAGTTKSLTAKCPKGERVDVGGFRSTVNEPSGILVEDLTFKGSRKWTATFDGLGESAPAASIAYCARGPRLTKHSNTEVSAAPPTGPLPGVSRWRTRGIGAIVPLAATAECPRGATVQLGGFKVRDPGPPGRGGAIASFRPMSMRATSARKWRVRGVTNGPGVRLTAVAGCGDAPAPDAVSRTEPVQGGGAKSSAKAKCPRGERVTMGGFKQRPFRSGSRFLRGLSRPSRRTWKVTAWEFGPPGQVTAIAYCS